MRRDPPLGFDEQAVGELRQVVVLEIQDLQLGTLQPIRERAHVIPACQQLPQTSTREQPVTQTQSDQAVDCKAVSGIPVCC